MTDEDLAGTVPVTHLSRAMVLAVAGGLQVLAQRHEVMFKDGSTVQLHPVLMHGTQDMFLRALQVCGTWLVTDLRKHGPELEDDVLRLQPRDTPGVVFFTLRSAYRCRDDFVRAVLQLEDNVARFRAEMLNGTGDKAAAGSAQPFPFLPPRQPAQSTTKDLFT